MPILNSTANPVSHKRRALAVEKVSEMNTELKTYILLNNEGKQITVRESAVNELRNMYAAGDWAAMLKDVNSITHMVLIEQNMDVLNAQDNGHVHPIFQRVLNSVK